MLIKDYFAKSEANKNYVTEQGAILPEGAT
jgi:hypothetical protein